MCWKRLVKEGAGLDDKVVLNPVQVDAAVLHSSEDPATARLTTVSPQIQHIHVTALFSSKPVNKWLGFSELSLGGGVTQDSGGVEDVGKKVSTVLKTEGNESEGACVT